MPRPWKQWGWFIFIDTERSLTYSGGGKRGSQNYSEIPSNTHLKGKYSRACQYQALARMRTTRTTGHCWWAKLLKCTRTPLVHDAISRHGPLLGKHTETWRKTLVMARNKTNQKTGNEIATASRTDEQKAVYIFLGKCCRAVKKKMSGLLLYVATWRKFEKTVSSEEIKLHKNAHRMMSSKSNRQKVDQWLPRAGVGRAGWEKWGVTRCGLHGMMRKF